MAKHSLVDMVQLTVRVPRGHEGFWSIINDLDLKGPWTLTQIDLASNVDRASSKDYVHRLERGGFVERVGDAPAKNGRSRITLWRLIKKPIEAPRLDRAGRELEEPLAQLLWRTMRMLKSFSCAELREAAELPGRVVTLERTRQFVLALASAGVLVHTQGQKAVYSLARDLGPKAPSISKTQIVFDRNSGQVIGQPTVEVRP